MNARTSGRSMRCEYVTPAQLLLVTKVFTAWMMFVPVRMS
jgi:hypothetical protein